MKIFEKSFRKFRLDSPLLLFWFLRFSKVWWNGKWSMYFREGDRTSNDTSSKVAKNSTKWLFPIFYNQHQTMNTNNPIKDILRASAILDPIHTRFTIASSSYKKTKQFMSCTYLLFLGYNHVYKSTNDICTSKHLLFDKPICFEQLHCIVY